MSRRRWPWWCWLLLQWVVIATALIAGLTTALVMSKTGRYW